MKKEDIKDAAVIAASAVVGSTVADVVTDIVETDYIDDTPTTYGPPPEYEHFRENDMENDNEELEWDQLEEVDDIVCVYGPPADIVDDGFMI